MSIEAAVIAIGRGRVIGVPTDTVYGVAVDPGNPAAVRALFDVKGRGSHLPLAVLVASLTQAEALVEFTPATRDMIEPRWPGAFTAILKSKAPMVDGVGDHHRGTLAVRMPDHRILAELLTRSGPLAVTSANRSGAPPALSAGEAREAFGGGVAVYLEGRCEGGRASTIVDLTRDPPQLLREGPVQFDVSQFDISS